MSVITAATKLTRQAKVANIADISTRLMIGTARNHANVLAQFVRLAFLEGLLGQRLGVLVAQDGLFELVRYLFLELVEESHGR